MTRLTHDGMPWQFFSTCHGVTYIANTTGVFMLDGKKAFPVMAQPETDKLAAIIAELERLRG